MSQDTLPSPLPIASLSKCYYTHCTTSDVYTTPVSTTVDTAVSIVFSNTVRTERSEDRHRMTPIGVLHTRRLRNPIRARGTDRTVPRRLRKPIRAYMGSGIKSYQTHTFLHAQPAVFPFISTYMCPPALSHEQLSCIASPYNRKNNRTVMTSTDSGRIITTKIFEATDRRKRRRSLPVQVKVRN